MRLKRASAGRSGRNPCGSWWRAPLVSSIFGAMLDTLFFFTVAFSAALIWLEPANDVSWAGEMLPLLGYGPEVPLWVSLAVADWGVKIALVVITLIPFRAVLRRARADVV